MATIHEIWEYRDIIITEEELDAKIASMTPAAKNAAMRACVKIQMQAAKRIQMRKEEERSS